MIISASYKTDIPAFYGRWFLNRLAAGWCAMTNPYGGQIYQIDLSRRAVQGFVFWSKNIAPFRDALDVVAARGDPFVVQLGISGYPRTLERAVADPAAALEQARTLRQLYGPQVLVWRYDPILLTSQTPPAWHRANFASLAQGLRGCTNEVIVSFLQLYRKTQRNLAVAARAHDFSWWMPDLAEKRALLVDLAAIAAQEGMRLTTCTQPELADTPGVTPARCIDATRLAACGGRPLRVRTKGNRPGCLCAESRDIGVYESCPHGCVYCYAVSVRAQARHAFIRQSDAAAGLGPGLEGPEIPAAAPTASPSSLPRLL